MSDGSIISISSNDDDNDDDREDSAPTTSPPPGRQCCSFYSYLPQEHPSEEYIFICEEEEGQQKVFHNPNAARTRRGNDVGKKGDNDKGSGAWGGDKLVVYALKLGKKGGTFEWEATVTRRLNADLIVCAQGVNMKEWEVTSSLSSFNTSSSVGIAT